MPMLWAVAHPDPPSLELKNQHNFVDITQVVTLCYIYFQLNNHLSCG